MFLPIYECPNCTLPEISLVNSVYDPERNLWVLLFACDNCGFEMEEECSQDEGEYYRALLNGDTDLDFYEYMSLRR